MNENESNVESVISEETKADYTDAFNMFDTNHDGTIDSHKIGEIMRKLGKYPSDKELQQIIQNVAKSGSNKIGFDDLLILWNKKIKKLILKLKL